MTPDQKRKKKDEFLTDLKKKRR